MKIIVFKMDNANIYDNLIRPLLQNVVVIKYYLYIKSITFETIDHILL